MLGPLGRGGMAVVYRARDRRLEREVAIKILADPSAGLTERFEVAARALAALEHDNIVRIYDAGIADGVPYLVMEYVRGQTLSSLLAAGRPTVLRTAEIAVDMLRGVQAAHRQGIIHRDLKPPNIFIEPAGRAKVADFGVARIRSSASETRQSISGTPGYMAPEQAQGRGEGPATDVYALGVVLHQMLSGQRLFTGRSLDEVLSVQLDAQPLPPGRVNPSVPPALSDLVVRALEIDPARRPTTETLLEEIEGWLDRVSRSQARPGAAGFPPAPYKLLEHFGPDDAVIFFGRRAESLELAALVASPEVRALFLFGPCGIGKSSLLGAGLIPALGAAHYEVVRLLSGPDPARALRDVVAARATAAAATLPDGGPFTGPALELSCDLAVYAVAELVRASGRTLVLILDQLEEVFTQNLGDSPRVGDLFELLVRLVEAQIAGFRIVMSYRGEFHASFFPLEQRLARYSRSYLVGQIGEAGLVDAIEGPSGIEFYRFQYEPGLPARLARDILETCRESGDTPLPIMQIICSQLHERAVRPGGSRMIGARHYEEALGGAAGALTRYVEAKLSSDEYSHGGGMARQILKALSVKEEGGERYARAREEEELLAFPDQAAARITLERLVADHLVIRVLGPDGCRHVRLASEVICRAVDGWEVEPDATERASRVLFRDHRQWAENGRRAEDLLGGGALDLVRAHLGALQDVTPEQRQFVELSTAARRRRRLSLAFQFAILAALVLSLTYYSFGRRGTIRLGSVPPGAEVSRGGSVLGITPLALRERPGVYKFTLALPRHDPVQEVVQVSAGATDASTSVLAYRYGLLQVSSTPASATCSVWSAGPPRALVGTWRTPFITELAPGDYMLSATRPGFLEAALRSPLSVGSNRKLTTGVITLARDAGWLLVDSPFDGVTMHLAGEHRTWETVLPMKRPEEMPAGRYRMVCARPGHESYVTSVDVRPNSTTVRTAWAAPVGKEWEVRTGGPVSASPAVADLDGDSLPDVVIGSQDRRVYAFSGLTGDRLWEHATGDEVMSSAALGDLDGDGAPDAVVGSNDRALHALGGRTGRPMWVCRTGGRILSSPALADLDGDGGLDAAVGSMDGRLYAVSGRTGAAIWTYATRGAVRSSPAVGDLDGDGRPDVVAGATDNLVHAVSGRTGRALWTHATGGWVASPALADLDGDRIPDAVVGSDDRRVRALSGRDGRPLWTRTIEGRIAGAPALADLDGDRIPDAVVGSDDRRVRALSGRDGRTLWTFTAGGPVRASPVAADLDGDRVPDIAVGAADGRVYVLSGRDGHRLWDHATRGWVGSPAVADLGGDGNPAVVVGSLDGTVRALTARPGGTAWACSMGADVLSADVPGDLDSDGHADALAILVDDRIAAVSGLTGERLWEHAAGSTPTGAAAFVDHDGDRRPDPVLGLARGEVRVVSGATGATLWSWTAGCPVTPLVVEDADADAVPDIVVGLGTTPPRVALLSGRTRAMRWSVPVPEEARAAAIARLEPGARTAPLVLVAAGRRLVALSATDGAVRWTGPESDEPLLAPAVSRQIALTIADRQLCALDVLRGTPLWEAVLDAPAGTPPVLTDFDSDGMAEIIAGSRYRMLQALSGRDGSPVWQVDIDGPLPERPLLLDLDGDGRQDVVIGTRHGVIAGVSGRSGSLLFRVRTGARTRVAPALLDRPGAGCVSFLACHDDALLVKVRVPWPVEPVIPVSFTRGRNATDARGGRGGRSGRGD
jgi:outer membrane protein assembly factor BamB